MVGKANGTFGEETMLYRAGEAEKQKWAQDKKPIPEHWKDTYYDNPIDHEWIKKGFKYYDKYIQGPSLPSDFYTPRKGWGISNGG